MSSRLQKKSSPGFVHDGLPICAWKHALAPQTRACLRHVIVNNVLVNADTWQASACHCEPRPRTRARLPAFSMSLQASVFARAHVPAFCMSLRGAGQPRGPRKAALCGERRCKEAGAVFAARRKRNQADFAPTMRRGNPRPRRETLQIGNP